MLRASATIFLRVFTSTQHLAHLFKALTYNYTHAYQSTTHENHLNSTLPSVRSTSNATHYYFFPLYYDYFCVYRLFATVGSIGSIGYCVWLMPHHCPFNAIQQYRAEQCKCMVGTPRSVHCIHYYTLKFDLEFSNNFNENKNGRNVH